MGNRATKDKQRLRLVGGIVSNICFHIFIGEQPLLLQWGWVLYKCIFKDLCCTTFYLTSMFEPFVSSGSASLSFPSNSDSFVDWFNYYLETAYTFRLAA